MAGQQVVEYCAETINIYRACDDSVVPPCLFWGHVAGCAQHVARAGNRAFCLDQSGQAEIGKMRFTLCIKQNVSRFNVPMQNAVLVGVVHGARQLCNESRCTTNRYRLAPN